MANYVSKFKIDNVTANVRDTNAHTLISNLTTQVNNINTSLTDLTSTVGSLDTSLTDLTDQVNNLDIVNVKDYGALGDGITDDTTAFINAVNDVTAHGMLYIPNGTYILSETIAIKKPMSIIGDYFGFIIDEDNDYTDIAVYSKKQIISSANPVFSIKACGVRIANLCVDGTGDVISGNMKNINSNTNVLRNIIIENCAFRGTGVGVKFDGSTIVSKFSNVWVWSCATSFQIGAENETSTSLLFENCWAINYTNAGYNLINCHYSVFIACASDTTPNGNYGYLIDRCKTISMISCGAEKTGIAGAFLYQCEDVLVNLECSLYNVNNVTGGCGIRMSGTKRVTFLNCHMVDDQTTVGKEALYFTTNCEFSVISSNFKVINNGSGRYNIGHNYSYMEAPQYTATNCTVDYLNFKYTPSGLIVSGQVTVTSANATIALTGYTGCTELVYGLTNNYNVRVYKRYSSIYFDGTATGAFQFTVNVG